MQWTTVIQDQKPLTLLLGPIHFPKDASAESSGRLPRTNDYVYWMFGGSAELFDVPDEEFYTMTGRQAVGLTLKLTENWKPAFRTMFNLQNSG